MSKRFFARTVFACGIACLGFGSGRGDEPRSEAAFGPMTSYKAGDEINPWGRIFLRWDRPRVVTTIHEEYVQDFIATPGQGGQRMVRIDPLRPQSGWVELIPDSEAKRPFEQKWADRNRLPSETVGSVAYDPVHESMRLKDGTVRAVKEQVWVVRSQDLMGVVAADGPAVYVIDLHTRHSLMRAKVEFKGKDAKKRDLTKFETEALKKLRDGDDVVLQSSAQEMNVLGAVRARKDCLACHKVDEGTLLGAFTYTLVPQSQQTPVKDRMTNATGLSREEWSAVLTVESVGGKVQREKNGPVREIDFTFARTTLKGNHVRLRDSALQVLTIFPELKALDVSHSHVTDEGLAVIAKLKKLERLELRGTKVTPEGLAVLKKELPDCQVRHESTEPIRP